MKKKIISVLLCGTLLAMPFTSFAEEADLEARVSELESEVAELRQMVEGLQAGGDSGVYSVAVSDEGSESAVQNDTAEYNMGETWTVDGQWELTVNSVETTDERNEYSDYNPAAVYIVTYTYTNLGYESEWSDGLYISLDDGIVDNAGIMGYDYPGDVTYYPQETPIGATCNAQTCIGVENAGSFTINFGTYDGNENWQSAVFNVEVE